MKRLLLLLVAALALLVPAVGQAGTPPPAIAFTPTPYDYGTIDANTTASQTFVLANQPNRQATGALKVSLTGSSAFSISADTCTAKSLGPKKSCSVTVQYAPTTAGSSDTGTLTAMSKKPAASASASLTGSTNGSECDSFNDPLFDGLYGALGTSGTFAAGDALTLSAGEPENPGHFPTTQIILSADESPVANASFPGGTIVYTFPADGFHTLQWNSDSGGVTWTVSCTPAS